MLILLRILLQSFRRTSYMWFILITSCHQTQRPLFHIQMWRDPDMADRAAQASPKPYLLSINLSWGSKLNHARLQDLWARIDKLTALHDAKSSYYNQRSGVGVCELLLGYCVLIYYFSLSTAAGASS